MTATRPLVFSLPEVQFLDSDEPEGPAAPGQLTVTLAGPGQLVYRVANDALPDGVDFRVVEPDRGTLTFSTGDTMPISAEVTGLPFTNTSRGGVGNPGLLYDGIDAGFRGTPQQKYTILRGVEKTTAAVNLAQRLSDSCAEGTLEDDLAAGTKADVLDLANRLGLSLQAFPQSATKRVLCGRLADYLSSHPNPDAALAAALLQ